jgi:hypothetical protein
MNWSILRLTHVDLRGHCTLREIPSNRVMSTDVCAGATIDIGLIICLQTINVQRLADLDTNTPPSMTTIPYSHRPHLKSGSVST